MQVIDQLNGWFQTRPWDTLKLRSNEALQETHSKRLSKKALKQKEEYLKKHDPETKIKRRGSGDLEKKKKRSSISSSPDRYVTYDSVPSHIVEQIPTHTTSMDSTTPTTVLTSSLQLPPVVAIPGQPIYSQPGASAYTHYTHPAPTGVYEGGYPTTSSTYPISQGLTGLSGDNGAQYQAYPTGAFPMPGHAHPKEGKLKEGKMKEGKMKEGKMKEGKQKYHEGDLKEGKKDLARHEVASLPV